MPYDGITLHWTSDTQFGIWIYNLVDDNSSKDRPLMHHIMLLGGVITIVGPFRWGTGK
jgi:hypothetical protein